METVLTWIGIALAALVAVAIVVACWENYRELAARTHARAELPPAARTPLQVSVDVDVDALPPAAASGDSADRRATLEQAMVRLAQPPAATAAATRPLSWPDTEPMVGPGAPTEPRRASAKAPSA